MSLCAMSQSVSKQLSSTQNHGVVLFLEFSGFLIQSISTTYVYCIFLISRSDITQNAFQINFIILLRQMLLLNKYF